MKDHVFKLDVAMDSLLIPTRFNVEEDVANMELSFAQHFSATKDDIQVLQVDHCDDTCVALWDKSAKYDGMKDRQVKWVRYYVHVSEFNVAQQMQDELYNGGAIYRTNWFAPYNETPKRLKDMKIEHCAGKFEELRVSETNDGGWSGSFVPLIDQASASHLVTFAALLSFFML
eukprot:TRINITY_DN594_c0_g1_i1.p1 TRINITY_DN594_c0_g1~~TRINITY_DN594_c0_g1_i1.p1  ORF type:complete len:173 (+),score=29.86 TRINITY_DN594_c0_g1_i1:254-772(+)